MNPQAASAIRHMITGLVAVATLALAHSFTGTPTGAAAPAAAPASQIGTLLEGKRLIAPDQVAEVNSAGEQLVHAVTVQNPDKESYIKPAGVILAALAAGLARYLIGLAAKWIPGSGVNAAVSGGAPLVLLGTAAAFMGSLPSCSSPGGPAAVPIHATVHTDYGTVGYSSKSGVSLDVDATSGK